MALKRLTIDGYGQLELNNVAFRRDGNIEAQCALDETDFDGKVIENGMLVAVDRVKRRIKFADDATLPIALNYSSEHMYDERTPGLKNFSLKVGEFLPRVGYLKTGELFTENCVCYDDGEFADDDAFEAALDAIATTPMYGTYSAIGAIKVTKTVPTERIELLVVEKTTMPDGQLGIKFQVNKA